MGVNKELKFVSLNSSLSANLVLTSTGSGICNSALLQVLIAMTSSSRGEVIFSMSDWYTTASLCVIINRSLISHMVAHFT